MASSIKHSLIWLIALASLISVVVSGCQWYEISRENGRIMQLLNGQGINLNDMPSAQPETRLARALFLQKQHRPQEALAALSVILNQGGQRFQAKTRYNLGNNYLRQAIAQIEVGRTDEAKTLVSLAKQSYREALLRDSGMWDAKYNLETAMRLLPDFDRINIEEEPTQQPKNPLWTSVPGFPRGLP